MIDPKELDDLKRGTFELDCVEMKLSRLDGSRTYTGPGYIRQGDDQQFYFRLFVPEQLDFRTLIEPRETQAGQIYREEHSWALEARDTSGRTWAGKRIWNPDRGGHVDMPGFTVGGHCYQLTRREDNRYESDYVALDMMTFQKFNFHRNRHSTTTRQCGNDQPSRSWSHNRAEFNYRGFDFSVQDEGEDDVIRVRATSKGQALHPQFERRIGEALMFAFGLDVFWCVSSRIEGGADITTISANYGPQKSLFPHPPLAYRPLGSESIWQLFQLYLDFIWSHTAFEFHPLSAQLHGILSGRKASGQIQALASSVAVESILLQFFKEVGAPSEEQVAAIDALLQYVGEYENKPMRERASQILNNLRQCRAIDRLYSLVDSNAVSKRNVEIWKEQRNIIAHGRWTDDFQDLIDNAGNILVLVYQLVFHLIGYKGEQTDWGVHGYPTLQYPPVVEATANSIAAK